MFLYEVYYADAALGEQQRSLRRSGMSLAIRRLAKAYENGASGAEIFFFSDASVTEWKMFAQELFYSRLVKSKAITGLQYPIPTGNELFYKIRDQLLYLNAPVLTLAETMKAKTPPTMST